VPGPSTSDQATFTTAGPPVRSRLSGQRKLGSLNIDAGTNSGYTFIPAPAASFVLDNATNPMYVTSSNGVNVFNTDCRLFPPAISRSPQQHADDHGVLSYRPASLTDVAAAACLS